MRSHYCGLVDETLIGQTVTLCGWVNKARVQSHQVFIDLRDHEGIVQLLVESDQPELFAAASALSQEDCLRVSGTIRQRHSINDKIKTGRVELLPQSIEVLNRAVNLPFHSHENPGEDVRLKYRYLDLRRPEMQRMMRTRTKLVQALRAWLDAQVGLVGTIAAHRLVVAHARKRIGQFHIHHFAEHMTDQFFGGVLHLGLIDPSEFHIELGEFELTIGAQGFVAKAAGNLIVAVEAGHHQDLLEQLRRLR